MVSDYDRAFEVLRHSHLEESWVLAVLVSEDAVSFDLGAVLTVDHPN